MAIPKKFSQEKKEEIRKKVVNLKNKGDNTKTSDEIENDKEPTPPIGGGVQTEIQTEDVEIIGMDLVGEGEDVILPSTEEGGNFTEGAAEPYPSKEELRNTLDGNSLRGDVDRELIEHAQIRRDPKITSIRPATSSPNSRSSSKKGVITFVNSQSNGKRITFPENVISKLGNPPSVSIGFDGDFLVVSKNHENLSEEFPIKTQGHKKVIYSASLVEEVTKVFKLDFTGKVSLTFHNVEYISLDDQILGYFLLNEK